MLKLLVALSTVAMIVLKLLDQFDHSWWIVFSPVIGYIALGVVAWIIAIIVFAHK